MSYHQTGSPQGKYFQNGTPFINIKPMKPPKWSGTSKGIHYESNERRKLYIKIGLAIFAALIVIAALFLIWYFAIRKTDSIPQDTSPDVNKDNFVMNVKQKYAI